MSPNQIDYRPLAGMNYPIRTTLRLLLLSKWIIGLFLIIAGFVVGIIISSDHIIVGAFLVAIVYPAFSYSTFKASAWKRFAKTNGWQTNYKHGDLPASLGFVNMLSYDFSDTIEIPVGNNLVCQLFFCDYKEQHVSSRDSFTIGSIVLPESMPHIMLRNKARPVKDHPQMDNAMSLQLEGNFNQYFDLQVEQGQQVNALTILTPDVMQTLITYNANEDIEINGTLLSFIISGEKGDIANIKALIVSAVELGGQIMENIRLAKTSQKTPTELPSVAEARA